MKGIDISKHNGWPLNTAAAAGYKDSDFVIVKATQGLFYSYTDFFDQAIKMVLNDGKLAGAYHYAKGYNPEKEADYYVSVISPYLGRIVLALDWETSTSTPGYNYAWGSTTWAKRFVDRVYALIGRICLIYTGVDGCRQCAALAGFSPLWFAGYPIGEDSWNVPAFPSRYNLGQFGSRPAIWQFTSGNNTLDRNTTNWTRADWQKYTRKITMKEVMIGSARIDENGNAQGGAAGDQTGREVCIEKYYTHSQGWYGLRAKDPAVAKKIAYAMKMACANPNIGYDQWQRNTLYYQASLFGFDPGKVKVACETDCSALVRVCLAYAGIHINDINTASEKAAVLATGAFTEFAVSKAAVRPGDILVTKTKGHTVIVVSGNEPEEQEDPAADPDKKGSEEMQCLFTIDGKNKETPYWFDGQKIHVLTHKDQAGIIRTIYKDNNGKAIPEYAWKSTAPWYKRLQQAVNGKDPVF